MAPPARVKELEDTGGEHVLLVKLEGNRGMRKSSSRDIVGLDPIQEQAHLADVQLQLRCQAPALTDRNKLYQ